MTFNPYSAPQTDFQNMPPDGVPALWNPKVAAALGFFLTPVFGALINMKNWQAMGEPRKALHSKLWAVATVLFTLLVMGLPLLLPDTGTVNWLFRGAGLAYFIAWYMISCKDQQDVMTYRYGTAFVKRGWTVPVLCAIGVYIGIVVIFAIAIFVYTASTS